MSAPLVSAVRSAAGRHTDHGPNAANTPPDAVVTLHRHALESIFSFLDLRESAAALRVSRDWTAAVGSMRRLELRMECPNFPLGVVAESALIRHVCALRCDFEEVQLDAADLRVLATRMSHLRGLRCYLQLSLAAGPLAFPAQLRRLDIHLADHAEAVQVNAAIASWCARSPRCWTPTRWHYWRRRRP